LADRHRAWLCDLDGTLYRPTGVKWAMALELALLGLGDAKAISVFRKQHESLREEYARGGVNEDANLSPYALQLQRSARALGVAEALLETRVRRWMIERPGRWIRRFRREPLIEEIRAFRAAGGKTAVVSDYPAREKLAALGVHGLFDVVVASGEEPGPSALKPDPSGYLIAAEHLGVPPEHCLVVGDRQDADGAAATAAGMSFRHIRS
jgi:HAD superfamily hydrolase (TIGR01549 family)